MGNSSATQQTDYFDLVFAVSLTGEGGLGAETILLVSVGAGTALLLLLAAAAVIFHRRQVSCSLEQHPNDRGTILV